LLIALSGSIATTTYTTTCIEGAAQWVAIQLTTGVSQGLTGVGPGAVAFTLLYIIKDVVAAATGASTSVKPAVGSAGQRPCVKTCCGAVCTAQIRSVTSL
jgi:hypothetical protein